MILRIIKPDGSSTDIELYNKQPTIDHVNGELLLFENYQYSIIVLDNETYDKLELFIGDYVVPLKINPISGCYETEKDILFSGCYDLVSITAISENLDGDEIIRYIEYVRIATTKQTARQVESMLEEIEKSLPTFLDVCFSKSRKQSGLINNEVRSIWNTLSILDEIIEVYDANYSFFCNHKKSSIEERSSLVDVKAMRQIDQDSLRWIIMNSECLVKAENETCIKYNNEYYFPSKVKSYISQYSYDVYENRVILGFLINVLTYIDDQIVQFEKELNQLNIIPQKIIMQLPNTHELTGRCIYVYYKGITTRLIEKRDVIQELVFKYERSLNCEPETFAGKPYFTNTFKNLFHYRLCYDCIVKWYETGDYSFDHISYLFKLKTLSRIFEYFCLIRLQTAITINGYNLQEATRITYDEDNTEEINNLYSYEGNGRHVSLFYEPTIWVDKNSRHFNLYSTGYNFTRAKWSPKWTPDFVIKIDDSTVKTPV